MYMYQKKKDSTCENIIFLTRRDMASHISLLHISLLYKRSWLKKVDYLHMKKGAWNSFNLHKSFMYHVSILRETSLSNLQKLWNHLSLLRKWMQEEMPWTHHQFSHIFRPELSAESAVKFLLLHLLFKLLHLSHSFRKRFGFLLRQMFLKSVEVNQQREIIHVFFPSNL
jgi:hypothetical protein